MSHATGSQHRIFNVLTSPYNSLPQIENNKNCDCNVAICRISVVDMYLQC